MKPLPGEGGYYVETYRASEKISETALPAGYTDQRSFSTATLYLLTPNTFSALHRLKSDEIFHFYLGDPVTMLQLHPDGPSEVTTLGQDIMNGQRVQVTVPKNSWQGCFLNEGGRFALMGCTAAPGFETQRRAVKAIPHSA
jgi:predicted cupin superfamily sugar epimerase